jgi:pimeloyl-ACP methyl ester carboxylesterase
MAIAHPERVLSLTSVMSSPGGVAAKLDPDVTEQFNSKPARSRDEAIAQHIANIKTWGSPAYQEVDRLSADAGAAYDRCFDPKGKARQVAAIFKSGSRQDALRALTVPALVIHGDADRLVPIELGRLTAECIPNARFEVVAGMGHDYPPQIWDTIVELISKHALDNA